MWMCLPKGKEAINTTTTRIYEDLKYIDMLKKIIHITTDVSKSFMGRIFKNLDVNFLF